MKPVTENRILPPREAHALWAESYDRNPNPLLALEERIVEPLLPSLDQKVILDLACGTGRWLRQLLRHGASVGIGVDFSPEMLFQARRKSSIQGNLILGDCTAMPIRAGAVDFAMCSFAASYFADLPGFARELSRVTRRPASLLLADFHPSAHLRGWKRAFRHDDTVVEVRSFQYSIDHICDVFRGQGFELKTRIEASFAETERHIFDECGKGDLLDQLGSEPAIFICHFQI